MTRKQRRLIVASVIGLVIGASAWTGIQIIASRPYQTASVLQGNYQIPVKWVLVIGRQDERESALQTDVPHRNSPIALYENVNGRLIKREGDLLTRSHSTADEFPDEADWETVKKYVETEEKPYPYGFVSVPVGLYHATPDEWGSGSTAYLLSSIENRDGYITLEAPQTIRHLFAREENGQRRFVVLPSNQATFGTYFWRYSWGER